VPVCVVPWGPESFVVEFLRGAGSSLLQSFRDINFFERTRFGAGGDIARELPFALQCVILYQNALQRS
jgi:hypothetical protein